MGKIAYTLHVYPEDSPPDYQDPGLNEEINARLARGEQWAWCTVEVRASLAGFKGRAFIGGCSYTGEAEFRENGYLPQMEQEAREHLAEEVQNAQKRVSFALSVLAEE